MRLSFIIISAALLCGCSTTPVISDEASTAVPTDYVTRHQLPVTLERAALILSHFGHTGDELTFSDVGGKKFIVYRLLSWRTDAPLFSPSREVGRLAVGDNQAEIRLVDYRGEEGRVLLHILSSVPHENEGFGMAEGCASFLKKKRKGLPNQITTDNSGASPLRV
jgi:hypothetical protein